MIILENKKVFNIKDSTITFYVGTTEVYTADANYNIEDLITEVANNVGVAITIDSQDKIVFEAPGLTKVEINNINMTNELSDMLGFTTIKDSYKSSVYSDYSLQANSILSLYLSACRIPYYLDINGVSFKGGFNLHSPFSIQSGKDEVSDDDIFSTVYRIRRGKKYKYTIHNDRQKELDTFLFHARDAKVVWKNTSFLQTEYQILINENESLVGKIDFLDIEQKVITMLEWME